MVFSMVPSGPRRLTVSVTGSTGMAAPVFSAAAIARAIRSALANGRAASWTRTISGEREERASRPARTDACRVAPPKTGGRIRMSRVCSRTRSMSSLRTTGCSALTAGTLAKPNNDAAEQGRSSDFAELFGHVAACAQALTGGHHNSCDLRHLRLQRPLPLPRYFHSANAAIFDRRG